MIDLYACSNPSQQPWTGNRFKFFKLVRRADDERLCWLLNYAHQLPHDVYLIPQLAERETHLADVQDGKLKMARLVVDFYEEDLL